MKITGPGQIQASSLKKTSKKKESDSSAFTDALKSGGSASGASAASAPSRLAHVDALLSLQEVPDSTEGRSKGLNRARDMLDLLEDVRRGILLGAIPGPQLRRLADMARNHRQSGSQELKADRKLTELLSDIELRAEVELAKLGL